MTRAWRTATAVGAACLLANCAINPVTGKRELALISEADEIAMGREGAAEVKQSIGTVQNQALQDYVSRIGKSIAASTERPSLPWDFTVLDDPTVNAFALPGGFIFVTRGLLTHMTNEAELASVLGHEIGHVTARHSVEQMSKQQLAQVGLAVGSILSPAVAQYGQLASAGLGLLFLKFSRDDESQADALGFRYALEKGYDVRQMVEVFRMLDRQDQLAGGGKLPEWQSTHPDPGNRVTATQARLAQVTRDLSTATVARDAFLTRIEGLVYGENPRQGYFEGTVFLHPDLQFRFEFPQGWQTQNQPSAVVGVSPEQDAIIQLTLASGSAATAAQQFFGQQGLQASNVSQTTVQGLPAVSGTFLAQTDQGAIAGVAQFVDFGGHAYQILAYTPQTLFNTYSPVFRRSLGTFARLTDSRALSIQPAHVQVVRIPRSMTLAQFNQQYPSTVSLEELAIINDVETTATLSAGERVKRVVR